jgi:hypothetical protein
LRYYSDDTVEYMKGFVGESAFSKELPLPFKTPTRLYYAASEAEFEGDAVGKPLRKGGSEPETVPTGVANDLMAGTWDQYASELIDKKGGGVKELRAHKAELKEQLLELGEAIRGFKEDARDLRAQIAEETAEAGDMEVGERVGMLEVIKMLEGELEDMDEQIDALGSLASFAAFRMRVLKAVLFDYTLLGRASYWVDRETAPIWLLAKVGLTNRADEYVRVILEAAEKVRGSGRGTYEDLIEALEGMGYQGQQAGAASKTDARHLKRTVLRSLESWGFVPNSYDHFIDLLRSYNEAREHFGFNGGSGAPSRGGGIENDEKEEQA